MLSYAQIFHLTEEVDSLAAFKNVADILDAPIVVTHTASEDIYSFKLLDEGFNILSMEVVQGEFVFKVKKVELTTEITWNAYVCKHFGVLNLTQHLSTPDQKDAGVFEPKDKEEVRNLLNFEFLPWYGYIKSTADCLADIAELEGARIALIGGAPYLMSTLEKVLKKRGIQPVYAYSQRVSTERIMPDGSVQKTNSFRHEGFVFA